MNLIKEGKEIFYAVPLVKAQVEKYNFEMNFNYAYCSLYFPDSLQSDDKPDILYLIKIFNFFTEEIEKSIDTVGSNTLLIGESLFYPRIPSRGAGKWIKIGEKDVERKKIEDIPNYKETTVTYANVTDRNYFLLKNGGFAHKWNDFPISFEKAKGLEFGNPISFYTIHERIYLILILKHFQAIKKVLPTEDKMQQLLYNIIREEPRLKKVDERELKLEVEIFLNLFLEDYKNRFYLNVKE